MLLLDINVWLALTFRAHQHHIAAANWFSGVAQKCYFCRVTQHGFLRISTNPSSFGPDAVSMTVAWQNFDDFLADPRVEFADEPADIEAHWRNFTLPFTFSPKVWSDAYLAAFAIAGGFELVTFDKALAQYSGVRCTVLKG